MKLHEGHVAIDPPKNVPVWDVDPYSEEILSNPEPYYRELQSKGPFAYIPRYSILACGRYAETREVFSDHARFVSSRGVGLQDFELEEPWRPASIVLEVDPPYHTKTRTVIARALSPRAVNVLKESFKAEADRLVDELLDRGHFEAVEDFAEAFPCNVFPDAVGLRQVDRRKLVDYGAMVFNSLGPDNDLRRKAMAKGPHMVPWVLEQCKRENLKPGGFGATIYEASDTGELTEEEAGLLVRSLLSAGVDTTVTGIGNALWCLAKNPEQFDRIKADPSLVRTTIDEVLRFTSPVHTFCRTTAAATEVSGIEIPQHAKILCVLGSANLDADHWPQADQFDVGRRAIGHLAFGVGVHGCVGQIVAKAEMGAVLMSLAEKVGAIEFDGEAVWRPNNSIHALDRMPMKMTR